MKGAGADKSHRSCLALLANTVQTSRTLLSAQFLEGEIPPTVEQMARMCGTDVVGYVTEGPGMSVYVLSNGTVHRTYVSTARGLEPTMVYYALLDRVPKGRGESDTEPHWLRRHDEYETS